MIVGNIADTDGDVMFSKTGKFTSEKFFILKKKDEILNGKKDPHSSRKVELPHHQVSTKLQKYIEELEEQKKRLNSKDAGDKRKPDPRFQPFTTQVGRWLRDPSKNKKYKGNPPPGMYNPRPINSHVYVPVYHQKVEVRPRSAATTRSERPPTAAQPPAPSQEAHAQNSQEAPAASEPGPEDLAAQQDSDGRMTQQDLEFNPDKPRRKVTGYVDLKKKTFRKPPNHGNDVVDPEGKQFEVREIPRVSSKYR